MGKHSDYKGGIEVNESLIQTLIPNDSYLWRASEQDSVAGLQKKPPHIHHERLVFIIFIRLQEMMKPKLRQKYWTSDLSKENLSLQSPLVWSDLRRVSQVTWAPLFDF